jgi:hypothetical protein
MDATLSTLESEASSMNAQMTMASVMVKTTKTLARLNRMVCLSYFYRMFSSVFLLLSDAITRFSKNHANVRTKYDSE